MRLVSSVKVFIILVILNIRFTSNAKAGKDIKDTIIDVLTGLTCETQGIGDLLRSGFPHTCISESFFTFVANIVAPLTDANTVLRLKINEETMFPHNCERNYRADPNDPAISFALCNNIKFAAVQVESIAMSVIAIAKAMVTGDDSWQDIKKAWTTRKNIITFTEIKGKVIQM